ncbi:MAG: sulfotransferase [Gammaproteobacteria bacterium]|nr:sulfotransferase [Gammaproteobacteria bacterium]MBU1978766.1 sulfotransferase [Gammaproteobacteria bacterium]
MPSQAIFVLGMHRSGTSALTGVLSLLGADPGPSLMPSHESINPKGFWEHEDIVAIHDRLLEALGSFWHDERDLPENWWQFPVVILFRREVIEVLRRDFGQSPLWIVKDPRMCRLLPLWLDILHEVGCAPYFVIGLRSPFEVARSLERRDGFSEAKSCLLWLEYLLEAERWSRAYPRVVVTYDQLLADWQATSRQIAEGLGLSWQSRVEDVAARINAFLEPTLRHHHALEQPARPILLAKLADEAYRTAINTPPDQLDNALASIGEEVAQASRLIAPWVTQIVAMSKLLREHQERETHLHAEIKRVKSTVSWRITKPLRVIWNLLRKIFPGRTVNL